jgi:hypothetical protein
VAEVDGRRSRREVWGLALLALTLAGLAGWQLLAPEEEALPGIAMPVRPPTQAAPAQPAADRPELTDILERPVFTPARRRYLPVAEALAAPPPPPKPADPPLSDSYQLMGLTSAGGQVTALLRAATGGALLRLRSGEQLEGWTLAGLAGRRTLAFERDGERQLLAPPGIEPRDGDDPEPETPEAGD